MPLYLFLHRSCFSVPFSLFFQHLTHNSQRNFLTRSTTLPFPPMNRSVSRTQCVSTKRVNTLRKRISFGLLRCINVGYIHTYSEHKRSRITWIQKKKDRRSQMTALAYRSFREKKWLSIICWQCESEKKKKRIIIVPTGEIHYWTVYREYNENTGLRISECATQLLKNAYNLKG